MKNKWLQMKRQKLHSDVFCELMAAMNDDTTLGELINNLPKRLKDYLLGCRIFELESDDMEFMFTMSIDNYTDKK